MKTSAQYISLWLFMLIILFSILYGCSFRHIGCLAEYNGEQVELVKYLSHGDYIVRPIKDTITFTVNEIDFK